MMRKSHRPFTWVCATLTLIAATGHTSSTYATSVVPMNMQTLAEHAGQVIMGDVASVRSYWATTPRRIESEITFKNVSYLKGRLSHSATTFRLVVPGGKVGNMQMRISCTPPFKVGQRHILFLLPTYKTYPTVGVAQGAFRLQADPDGIERVYHPSGLPITEIDAEGFARVAGKWHTLAFEHLNASNNLRVKNIPSSAVPSKAMTSQGFLTHIRPILDRSKDHNLTVPAGRRILVDFAATSLKFSPKQQASLHAHPHIRRVPATTKNKNIRKPAAVQEKVRSARPLEREIQP